MTVSMSFNQLCRREIRVDARVVKVTDQQHKMALALLLRHPERWVSRDELADAIWSGCKAPDRLHDTIKVYASQLRKLGVPVVGRRKSGGYRIVRA